MEILVTTSQQIPAIVNNLSINEISAPVSIMCQDGRATGGAASTVTYSIPRREVLDTETDVILKTLPQLQIGPSFQYNYYLGGHILISSVTIFWQLDSNVFEPVYDSLEVNGNVIPPESSKMIISLKNAQTEQDEPFLWFNSLSSLIAAVDEVKVIADGSRYFAIATKKMSPMIKTETVTLKFSSLFDSVIMDKTEKLSVIIHGQGVRDPIVTTVTF